MRYAKACCIAAALLLLAVGVPASANTSEYSAPLRLAIDGWLASQKASGFFTYGYDFVQDKEAEPDTLSAPNLTRQAGAAAVLADYYAQAGDPRTRAALVRLLGAFRHHSLPIGKSRLQALLEEARVLSLPFGRYKLSAALDKLGLLYEKSGRGKVVSPAADYAKAYTGATALALLTELRYAQASGDQGFADLRGAWVEGLATLWIPDEGFRQYPTSIEPTPFFDGEAWRALAEYHRAYPQDARVNALLPKVDKALMKNYGGDFRMAFYHWGTMAAAARYAETRDRKFLDFIKAQTRAFLDHAQEGNGYLCSWLEGTADGLGALLKAQEGDTLLARQAQAWVADAMPKVLRLQISPQQREIVLPNIRIPAPHLQQYVGSFRGGTYSVKTRVDFTSHCVSAMLKLQRNAAIGTTY